MTNGTATADEPDNFERPGLTPEQLERLRRMLSGLNVPTIKLPDSLISTIAETTRLFDARLDRLSTVAQQLVATNARVQAQMSTIINSDALQNLMAAQTGFTAYASRLIQNIDFSGIAVISEQFAEQQSALFKNLVPALEAMRATRAGFYPPNLRGIDRLDIASVNNIVMAEGIPLYGVPRTSIAEALIHAESESARRTILGRWWKTISTDCRELLTGCTAPAVAQYVTVALAALDALDAGHPMAAQALTGSLIDVIVNGYFGKDRYAYTPSRGNPTNGAYEEFTIREFIAFAPIWQAYQQFFVSNGDKIPMTFSRNATVHTVSSRQYSRRNAVQGLMLVTSLLYRWNEEVAAEA